MEKKEYCRLVMKNQIEKTELELRFLKSEYKNLYGEVD